MSDKIKPEKQVEKNKEAIHRYVTSELPLEIIYYNIRILARQNERLIASINSDKQQS